EKVVGRAPHGYRSPAADLTRDTVQILIDNDFLYDSSCMGSDLTPYYLRSGDVWSTTEPFRFGETTGLVEIPLSWILDDFPQFEFIPGVFGQLEDPTKPVAIWRQEFDFMVANEPEGIYVLTLHPECIGRGHRLVQLRELIAYMAGAGARFRTMID